MPRHIVYVKQPKEQQAPSNFQAPPCLEVPHIPPQMPSQKISVFNQEQTINLRTIMYVFIGIVTATGLYFIYKRNRQYIKKNTLYF